MLVAKKKKITEEGHGSLLQSPPCPFSMRKQALGGRRSHPVNLTASEVLFPTGMRRQVVAASCKVSTCAAELPPSFGEGIASWGCCGSHIVTEETQVNLDLC